jgi:gas vesicle protein GvpL/GvpF
VRDREQMTVRVFAAEGARAEAAGAAAGVEDGRGIGPGARYLAGRAQQAGTSGIPGLQALLERMAPLVTAQILERHETAPLMASVYHLVERGSGPRYRDALRAAAETAPELRVVASGPWPPYAFASGVA